MDETGFGESPRDDRVGRRLSTDRLLAFSAVLLSLAALVVSIFQTAILREQQRASAWPHLQVHLDRRDASFELRLLNNGVGPAVLESVSLSHAGQPYEHFGELFQKRVQRFLPDTLDYGWFYAGLAPGEVLRAGQEVELLRSIRSYEVQALADSLMRQPSTTLSIEYADVYGNRWLLRDGEVEGL